MTVSRSCQRSGGSFIDNSSSKRSPTALVAVSGLVLLIALALALTLMWVRAESHAGWSIGQQDGVRALIETELPQATKEQQACVVSYIAAHLSPSDWTTMVQRYAEAFRDAVRVEADASGCA